MDQQLSILILPNEILEVVLKKMSTSDKMSLRSTCKRMEANVMRQCELHPTLSDATVDSVLRIRQPFSKLRIQNLTTRTTDFVRGLSNMAVSITQLIIHHELTSGSPTSLLNCNQIFQMCTNVTQLVLSGDMLNVLPIGQDFFISISRALTQLRKLNLEFCGIGHRRLVLHVLAFARFPELDSFVLRIGSLNQWKLRRMEYAKITKFVAMHWSTLRFLKIDDQGHFYSTLVDGDPVVPTTPDILELVGKVELESFEWYTSHLFATSRSAWSVAPDLISSQRKLKKLHLDLPINHSLDSVRMAVTGSCHTLESFQIQVHPSTTAGFDCQILSECHRLKQMKLSHPYEALNMNRLPQSIQDLHWNSPIGYQQVQIIQQRLINLTCLRLGDRSHIPQFQHIVQQIFLIPKLKIIRLHSSPNLGLWGLITLAALNFDPPANIIHHLDFDIINGVKVTNN